MPITTLHIHRHDETTRALIALTGEIDLDSAPLLSAALRQCLCDGIRTIDVDLGSVAFCDCRGLGAFLDAAARISAVGGVLRLHSPSPAMIRLLACTDTGHLLLGPVPGDAPEAAVAPRHSPGRSRQRSEAALVAVSGGPR